jgi:hypothetical protein
MDLLCPLWLLLLLTARCGLLGLSLSLAASVVSVWAGGSLMCKPPLLPPLSALLTTSAAAMAASMSLSTLERFLVVVTFFFPFA